MYEAKEEKRQEGYGELAWSGVACRRLEEPSIRPSVVFFFFFLLLFPVCQRTLKSHQGFFEGRRQELSCRNKQPLTDGPVARLIGPAGGPATFPQTGTQPPACLTPRHKSHKVALGRRPGMA